MSYLPELLTGLRTERNALREQVAGLRREVQLLRGAMAAQDERERIAGERCGVPYELGGCDWPDAVADKVEALQRQVAEMQRKAAAFDWLDKHITSAEPMSYWDDMYKRWRWRYMGQLFDTLIDAVQAAMQGGAK